MASVETLKSRYAAQGVEFVVVYVEDPHPGEPGYRDLRQPESLEERTQYAKNLVGDHAMEATVVVDEMDDAVWKLYGSLPNMIYVIDRDGRVAYHATWTMPDQIDGVLSELTANA